MAESNGNNLSSRERNLSGLPADKEEISIYLNNLDRADHLLSFFVAGIKANRKGL